MELCCLLSHGLVSSGMPGVPGEWRAMLDYVAALHRRSVRAAEPPFAYDWEEIGPGYCYGPAFGHFDIVQQVLDVVRDAPEHARRQMLNDVGLQRQDGSIPAPIWMGVNPARKWVATEPAPGRTVSHPPVWPVAVEACLRMREDEELLSKCYAALVRQIAWFDAERRAADGGYFYEDVRRPVWESGIDFGARFEQRPPQPAACVDATSHVLWCRMFASAWAARLGQDPAAHEQEAARLRTFIRGALFCDATGWFHDAWSVNDPSRRHLTFEGMWPLVVGAALPEQAARALSENLLNPERFNTPHPIATISPTDPKFELRMWRGPAWNSMTLWAVEGCLRYGRAGGARELLAKALTASTAQFARTGTVWEFYHPLGGDPESVQRKPHTEFNKPCRDYLGHNPLHAMARVWSQLAAA